MSSYVLFKFRDVNKYLIDSLVKGYLYFAHPDRLNDPFDCQVDIKRSSHNAMSKLSGNKKANLAKLAGLERYFDQIQKDTGKAGICSFSLELEPCPRDRPAQHPPATLVHSVHREHVLCQIDPHGSNLLHDFPSRLKIDDNRTSIFGTSMPCGSPASSRGSPLHSLGTWRVR